jgi:hypothetical protein
MWDGVDDVLKIIAAIIGALALITVISPPVGGGLAVVIALWILWRWKK